MPKTSLAVAALLALGVTIAAVARPPLQPIQPVVRPGDPALAPVPTDAFYFASVRVSKLWDNPAAKPLRDWVAAQKGGTFDAVLGLPPAEIDRLTLFAATSDPGAAAAPLLMATTRKQYNEAAVLKALGTEKPPRARPAEGRAFEVGGAFRWIVFLDDRTILYLPRDLDDRSIAPNLLARLIARKADGPLAVALLAAQEHDLTVGIDVRGVTDYAQLLRLDQDRRFVPFLALLKAKSATLTADFDKTAKVQFTLAFPDADAAKRGAPVLEEGIKTVAALLPDMSLFGNDPAGHVVTAWAVNLLKGAKVTALGTTVIATADAPFADELAKFVAAMPKQLAAARNERAAINNLKQIGIAHHNFHDVHNRCASDVMPTGDQLLAWSWRVQILPFIEQDNLYKQLDFTKAWDDPANLKLLESFEMPKVFEFPGRAAPKGYTYFRIPMMPKDAKGTDRPWLKEGERGPQLGQIPDGTSNTFMVVEAAEAVPWYKPDVLAYDGKLPVPALGDKDKDRFLALFGDGSVRSFRLSKIDEKTLRALITIQGGEVIRLSD